MRRLIVIAGVALVSLLGISVPAAAGGNSTLPPGSVAPMSSPCGAGYTHIGHYAIGSGPVLGYADVYWSSGAKRNCLVTNHSSATWGASVYTQARIRPHGWSWPSCPSSTGCDAGFYSYYAGPVYTPPGVDMSNRCIDFEVAVDWQTSTRTRLHCG